MHIMGGQREGSNPFNIELKFHYSVVTVNPQLTRPAMWFNKRSGRQNINTLRYPQPETPSV